MKFIKYYTFTVNYFNLSAVEAAKTHTLFLTNFSAIKLFLYRFLKKTRSLMAAFFAFISKIYRYATLFSINFVDSLTFSYKRFLSLSVNAKYKPISTAVSLEMRAATPLYLRNILVRTFERYLTLTSDTSSTLTVRLRRYLKFTLLTRYALQVVFFKKLKSSLVSSVVHRSESNRRFSNAVLLNTLIRNLVYYRVLNVLMSSPASFRNLLIILRKIFCGVAGRTKRKSRFSRRLLRRFEIIFRRFGDAKIIGEFSEGASLFLRLLQTLRRLVFARVTPKKITKYKRRIFTGPDLSSLQNRPAFAIRGIKPFAAFHKEKLSLINKSLQLNYKHLFKFTDGFLESRLSDLSFYVLNGLQFGKKVSDSFTVSRATFVARATRIPPGLFNSLF